MAKKIFALSILLGTALFMVGCGSQTPTERLGGFLGDLGCLTVQTDANFSLDEINAIGAKYGFNSDQELLDYMAGLTDADVTAAKTQATTLIEANCGQAFTDSGVEPSLWLDLIVPALTATDTTTTDTTTTDTTTDTTVTE